MASTGVIKQERSMAVYSRVDIVSLAEIYVGLVNINCKPKTLSALISYCVEIAHNALGDANHIDRRFEGVMEAYNILLDLGIMTRSMHKLNLKKVNNAGALENLRKAGEEPQYYAPQQFNTLHNDNSVEVLKQIPDSKIKEYTDSAVANYKEIEKAELIENSKIKLTDEERWEKNRRKDIPSTNPPAECKPFELITPDMFKKMTIEERKNMTFEQMKEMKRLLQTAYEQKIRDDAIVENERLRLLKKGVRMEEKSKGIVKEVVSHSNTIRHKTDEELRIGQLEREKKERDMNSIMDLGIPEPTARASKGDLLPECNEPVN